MGKCVVKSCESTSQTCHKSGGITFHVVPKDAVRREKWIRTIRILRKETDWLPTKNTTICSKHFRDEDKVNSKSDNGRLYLSKDAVPIIDTNIEEAFNLEPEKAAVEAEFVDIDGVETDDELTEITESWKQHKMREVIYRLRVVSSNRLKKVKSLLQRNRRLTAKNKQLKDIIDNLTRHPNVTQSEINADTQSEINTDTQSEINAEEIKRRIITITGKIKVL